MAKKFTFQDYKDLKSLAQKEYYYYTHTFRNDEEDKKKCKYYSYILNKMAKFENDTLEQAFKDYDIQKDIFFPLWSR